MNRDGKKRFDFLWLILPWLTAGALFAAEVIGFRGWLFTVLPSRLGTAAMQNVGWGLLLVTFGSSARWAYLRYGEGSNITFGKVVSILSLASLITIAHICVAAGILFAGCMIIKSNW
jgi:hypothetical protein